MLSYVTPLTVLGYPVVSMPIGSAKTPCGHVVPVGAQVVGKRGADAELLAICAAIEGVTGGGPPLPFDD